MPPMSPHDTSDDSSDGSSDVDVERGDRSLSVRRVIPAAPEEIFAVITDPSMHPVIDGSGTVKGLRTADAERLGPGSRFGMRMRIGVPYLISNVVVEYEEHRRIAWRHFARHRWRFELEPVDGGTEVVHTFDWSTALAPRYVELMRYPQKHPASMARTLERLEEVVTAGGDAAAGS